MWMQPLDPRRVPTTFWWNEGHSERCYPCHGREARTRRTKSNGWKSWQSRCWSFGGHWCLSVCDHAHTWGRWVPHHMCYFSPLSPRHGSWGLAKRLQLLSSSLSRGCITHKYARIWLVPPNILCPLTCDKPLLAGTAYWVKSLSFQSEEFYVLKQSLDTFHWAPLKTHLQFDWWAIRRDSDASC